MAAEVSKIQDYAIIGNARSAALVSNRGSLDWLCWPRFDSPSIFGAIIDPTIGGCWSICPESDSGPSRRYIDNTNVLETTFSTDSAKVVLTDFMPVTSEEEKKRRLWPEHELIRQIQCAEGEMELSVEFNPRLDYGSTAPKIRNTGKFGWKIDIGTIVFSFTLSTEAPAVVPPLAPLVAEKLNLTIDWWKRWAAQSSYGGPYESQV